MHDHERPTIAPPEGLPPSIAAFLARRTLNEYLLCGDWARAARAVGCTGFADSDMATRDLVLTDAATLWHGLRTHIVQALDTRDPDERIDRLAVVALDVRERFGNWDAVRALFERHARSPAGGTLSGSLLDDALHRARTRAPGSRGSRAPNEQEGSGTDRHDPDPSGGGIRDAA